MTKLGVFSAIILFMVFYSHSGTNAAAGPKPVPLAVIPTEMVNNRTIVRLPIAQYQLHMVLDTGASSTALFQSAKHEFGDLKKTGTAQILFPALNETVTGSRLEPVTIQFDEYSYTPDDMLLIHKRPPIGDRLNFRFDGVLGQDFFSHHVVEIDPEQHVLKLYPSGTNLKPYFFTNLKLHMRNTAPHIKFNYQLPWERRTSPKELLLDTGFPGLMVIWNAHHFSMAAGKSNIATYKAENKGIFTRATFKIGKLKFFDAPVFIGPNVPKQAQKRDGLIGANVLNQFHHVIDFGNKQLLLDAGRYSFDRIDGHFYLPNNEDYIYKRFNEFDAASKFVIE